jgi:tetratricopeptide (TPR) repeat protein
VRGLAATSDTTAKINAIPEPPPPTTPREFFNAGTQKLRAGKLREAEALLEASLSSQIQRLQPPTLYNLGEVRFNQGIEELKKSAEAGPTAAREQTAAQQAGDAIKVADAALASDDVQQMVAAYLNGRGARKELKAATEAVRRAMAVHGVALGKWQRALGDFKGTIELKGSDADAQHNADVVDRCIAKLVDSLREMQQAAQAAGDKSPQLGEKLKQLKGKIPADQMPPGGAGEDDEDEDRPNGPKEGDKEGPSKDGKEMQLTPEQAGWLLEGFKLDADRRLPMGQNANGKPKDRKGPTW